MDEYAATCNKSGLDAQVLTEYNNTTFVRPSQVEVYAAIGMLIVFSVCGVIGNGIVLYVFARKNDRLVSTIFIITLAVVDMLASFILMPFTAYMQYIRFTIDHDSVCKLYYLLVTTNTPFSAFIMVAIAFDRYFSICHPFVRVMTLIRAKVLVVILALITLVISTLAALSHGVFNVDYTWTISDELRANYTLVLKQCGVTNLQSSHVWAFHKFYLVLIGLCLVHVVVLYTLIYRSVLARRLRRHQQKKATSSLVNEMINRDANGIEYSMVTSASYEKNETQCKMEKERRMIDKKELILVVNLKTAAILFIVTVVFLIANLPPVLVILQVIAYSPILSYFYFISNISNPVIYSFMNINFRNDLYKLACSNRDNVYQIRSSNTRKATTEL